MSPMEELLTVMARLRDPRHGCPWDVEQDFASIAPCTIEEAYEVADAIARGDREALRDELGDLLLQVVFHAQMASEEGSFRFDDVVIGLRDKLVRRHPHVFGDRRVDDAQEVSANWEAIKREERGPGDGSALAGIAAGLPEWLRALKLQKRAARTGFEWPDITSVIAKLREEVAEVEAELERGGDADRLEDEIGDVLFVAINLARHANVDPGAALRRANAKFEQRFRAMEVMAAAEGQSFDAMGLAGQELLWQRVKRRT
ncbi:nucleoside triphosphate pyrophosphohydrolase [Xanthomonadaceae bacterium JHOS43]|nr:nucleoside triphosphate pyrophosphohydrolase [Xanthomonadaceae bacterium JHOS43]MCX7562942.1 nucleoside triphosphate pyrophosphohydrolase [Xanthomonadaceae bacterium XH05]